MDKHISLDFWGTIAQSNPDYRAAFNDVLVKRGFDLSEIDRIRRVHKNLHDDAPLHSSAGAPTTAEVVNDFLIHVGVKDADVAEVSSEIRRSFLDNPPIIDPNVVDVIRELPYSGITVSIGSNTNFVGGETILQTIPAMPFLFTLFSDQCGVSKPHGLFFNTITRVYEACCGRDAKSVSFIHIGDDERYDGGCVTENFQYICATTDTLAGVLERI